MKFHQIFELTQEELDVVMGRKIPEELDWSGVITSDATTWYSPDNNVAVRDGDCYLLVGDDYVLVADIGEVREEITGKKSLVRPCVLFDVGPAEIREEPA